MRNQILGEHRYNASSRIKSDFFNRSTVPIYSAFTVVVWLYSLPLQASSLALWMQHERRALINALTVTGIVVAMNLLYFVLMQ